MRLKEPKRSALDIAVMSLRDSAPDLTGESLVAAIRSYDPTPKDEAVSLPPAKVLRMKEAAARLDCSVRTVDRLVKAGKLPKIMLGKRSARIPEAAVIRLVQEGGVA